jgi:outer membrane protein TolC
VSMFIRAAVVALAGALAASCTLGPDYKRPVVQPPSTFRGTESSSAESLADLKWFDVFRDDTLNELVASALKENFEMRIAAERVQQARELYGITRADRFPTVDASVDLNALRSSQAGANRGIPQGVSTDVTYVQAGFTLGWEIDVWGRLRRLNEAARAQYL